MRQYMHLVMAGVWLVIALGLLSVADTNPDSPYLRLPGTGLPALWLVFALVFYNLLRWWRIQARTMAGAARSRRRTEQHGSPPNPDFDFSDAPARDKRLDPPPP
jgi:hypothetical protein